MEENKKPKLSKFTKTLIVVFVIIISFYLLNNAFFLIYDHITKTPLIEDTNVEKINIRETITLYGIEYKIKSLDLGDNYSALYFTAVGITSASPIGGAKLYQNEKLLPFICAASSSGDGSAIGFAPANGCDNLELHFDEIEEIKKTIYEYELNFENNTSTIDVEINNIKGQITIILFDEDYVIGIKGLEELEVKKEFGNRNPIIFTLLKDGKSSKDFTASNPPTHIAITVKESVYINETVIIPVS